MHIIKVRRKGEARNEFNESIVHNYTLLLGHKFGFKLPSSQSKKGKSLSPIGP